MSRGHNVAGLAARWEGNAIKAKWFKNKSLHVSDLKRFTVPFSEVFTEKVEFLTKKSLGRSAFWADGGCGGRIQGEEVALTWMHV